MPLDATTQQFEEYPICSVLPQQHRIARLFKPIHLRLESCPQSYPPFGWMCCNQTMSVSEMITVPEQSRDIVDAMGRSGAACAIPSVYLCVASQR